MSAVDEYESETGVGNLLGSSPFMQTCRGAALADLTDMNMIKNKIRLSELFRRLSFRGQKSTPAASVSPFQDITCKTFVSSLSMNWNSRSAIAQ